MRRTGIYTIGLLFLLSAGLLDTVQARQEGDDDSNKVDASIRRLISAVDPERISKHLFYLAKNPLPYRKLNLTLPGHEKNTLYEADDYLAGSGDHRPRLLSDLRPYLPRLRLLRDPQAGALDGRGLFLLPFAGICVWRYNAWQQALLNHRADGELWFNLLGDIKFSGPYYYNIDARGRAYVYYGGIRTSVSEAPDRTLTGESPGSRWYRVTLGDVNNDGYDDVIIGGYAYNNDQGRAWLYYSGPLFSTDVTFSWDTTKASKGEHTLKAEIVAVAGEEDTADNIVTTTINVKEPPQ